MNKIVIIMKKKSKAVTLIISELAVIIYSESQETSGMYCT